MRRRKGDPLARLQVVSFSRHLLQVQLSAARVRWAAAGDFDVLFKICDRRSLMLQITMTAMFDERNG